jgi:hypothetical protein
MPFAVQVDCCVVIPVYRSNLSASERASVVNTCRLLGQHSIRLLCPDGINLQAQQPELLAEMAGRCPDFDILALDPAWFASTATYNALLLSPSFYRLFLAWRHILIAQIDAWIFSPDLSPWLQAPFSYVGAPWQALPALPPGMFCPAQAVGNGGLSLRNVCDHDALLASWRYKWFPVLGLQELLAAHVPLDSFRWRRPGRSLLKVINRWRLIVMRLLSWRNSLAYYALCGLNEDIIFSLLAPRVIPNFRVPDPAIAAHFSLDAHPDFFYQRYIQPGQLPFGCHAWEKTYALFWRHLKTNLPSTGPEPPPHEH